MEFYSNRRIFLHHKHNVTLSHVTSLALRAFFFLSHPRSVSPPNVPVEVSGAVSVRHGLWVISPGSCFRVQDRTVKQTGWQADRCQLCRIQADPDLSLAAVLHEQVAHADISHTKPCWGWTHTHINTHTLYTQHQKKQHAPSELWHGQKTTWVHRCSKQTYWTPELMVQFWSFSQLKVQNYKGTWSPSVSSTHLYSPTSAMFKLSFKEGHIWFSENYHGPAAPTGIFINHWLKI